MIILLRTAGDFLGRRVVHPREESRPFPGDIFSCKTASRHGINQRYARGITPPPPLAVLRRMPALTSEQHIIGRRLGRCVWMAFLHDTSLAGVSPRCLPTGLSLLRAPG